MRDHVIAVDVGTGSARAGIVDVQGTLLCRREHPIETRFEGDTRAEHASEQIWRAVCVAVGEALSASGVAATKIAAIAFDATCSLVLRDRKGEPLALTREDGKTFDTILWLDHRAAAEADECTATDHAAIRHTGEVMSPEMEIPKLLWLKRHRPDLWNKLGYAFDLADFLTWRASGSNARSLCTITAKWNFQQHQTEGWPRDFLAKLGLDDLEDRASLPRIGHPVGDAVGRLTRQAAADLGLDVSVVVASGMVDAYAGALGVLGGYGHAPQSLSRQIALIGGTSSCLIAFAPEPRFRRSLWGPYYEAVFPGQWLVEAGQSATGALLNHLLSLHSAGGTPTTALHQKVIARVSQLRAEAGPGLADHINILPDFHGNRSPFADPNLTGVITGLTLDTSFDGLCRLYWRACVAIALGLRQILETMAASGMQTEQLHLTGGHVKNPLLTELYGDVTGCDLAIPETDDAVLVGTAINAAAAARLHPSLAEAGRAMAPKARMRKVDPDAHRRYERDYRRFLAMQRHRAELDGM
ncbi:FGGY-family carbohydrate kinase [Peteryoungia desertarenae]|uniref:FGGY-family carbohydrate kinase n=1 Tax=Peteryoungia desertarenae TaxID=1813451 RepID=A0ABX6QRA4_9HYPH|nr:FGGY-family carbohydrate kinase [Peteryoungia desertarenae]QLF71151.1 FGGY-family carbohydrate kinase [Peteryoungia desertarenae]